MIIYERLQRIKIKTIIRMRCEKRMRSFQVHHLRIHTGYCRRAIRSCLDERPSADDVDCNFSTDYKREMCTVWETEFSALKLSILSDVDVGNPVR